MVAGRNLESEDDYLSPHKETLSEKLRFKEVFKILISIRKKISWPNWENRWEGFFLARLRGPLYLIHFFTKSGMELKSKSLTLKKPFHRDDLFGFS